MTLSKSFKSTFLFILFLIFFGSIYLFRLDAIPQVVMDEPWYANTAYQFSKGLGLHNTNAYERGGDQFFLYTVFLGVYYKFFPVTLWASRAFSVAFGALTLVGLLQVMRVLRLHLSSISVGVGLFITSPVFYILFRRVRPEVVVVTFTIWAFYFLGRALKDQKSPLPGAIVILLSAFAHPFGSIGVLSYGGGWVIGAWGEKRVIRESLKMVFAGLIGVGLFFCVVWLFQHQSPVTFLKALYDPHRIGNESVLSNFTNFWTSYTVYGKRSYFAIVEGALLLFGGVYFWRKQDRWVAILAIASAIYFLGLLLIFNPLFRWAVGPVLVLQIPVFASIIETLKTRSLHLKWIGMGLISLYILGQAATTAYFIYKNKDNAPYSRIERQLKTLPPSQTIVTQMGLWFALKDHTVITEVTRWHYSPFISFENSFESKKVDYVILTTPDPLYKKYFEKSTKSAASGEDGGTFFAKGYGIITVMKMTETQK